MRRSSTLDLRALINESIAGYKEQGVDLPAGSELIETVLDFMLDRFRAWYQDEKIAVEVFLAVRALKPSRPYDFDKRVRATAGFMALPEASALASANKRVSNILAKGGDMVIPDSVDSNLLQEAAERDLDIALAECRSHVEPLLKEGEYNTAMNKLATLKNPVDTFFDQVMVNADDEQVKLNRYALLKQLHALFMHIADISLLQKS